MQKLGPRTNPWKAELTLPKAGYMVTFKSSFNSRHRHKPILRRQAIQQKLSKKIRILIIISSS